MVNMLAALHLAAADAPLLYQPIELTLLLVIAGEAGHTFAQAKQEVSMYGLKVRRTLSHPTPSHR